MESKNYLAPPALRSLSAFGETVNCTVIFSCIHGLVRQVHQNRFFLPYKESSILLLYGCPMFYNAFALQQEFTVWVVVPGFYNYVFPSLDNQRAIHQRHRKRCERMRSCIRWSFGYAESYQAAGTRNRRGVQMLHIRPRPFTPESFRVEARIFVHEYPNAKRCL